MFCTLKSEVSQNKLADFSTLIKKKLSSSTNFSTLETNFEEADKLGEIVISKKLKNEFSFAYVFR